MKFWFSLLFSIFTLFLFPSSLYASGFQLKTVGALNVEGSTYNHLWYTNPNVTFTGIALQNATVNATINGQSSTINADSEGNWSYTTTLNQGDNTVSFESGGSTISFTLTIGEVPENVGSLNKAETPTAGTITPTITIFSLGILSISAALLLKKKFT